MPTATSLHSFEERERRTGVRLSWNAWPASKSDAEALVAPLGLLFQPMKKVDGLKTLTQPAVRCSHCRGVLNPHAHVEPHNRRWRCPLCSSWNSLPDRLLQMGGPPPEVLPEHSVVEYDEEAQPERLWRVLEAIRACKPAEISGSGGAATVAAGLADSLTENGWQQCCLKVGDIGDELGAWAAVRAAQMLANDLCAPRKRRLDFWFAEPDGEQDDDGDASAPFCFTTPVSTTNPIPSTVSEVSAMLVEKISFLTWLLSTCSKTFFWSSVGRLP